jgi:molecular chaperone GrpE
MTNINRNNTYGGNRMDKNQENPDIQNDELEEQEEKATVEEITNSGAKETEQKNDNQEDIKDPLTEKQNEIDALKDKYLRLMAEFDNYKKRTQKEKESIYSDSKVDVLKQILPVLDNLERAYDSAKASSNESNEADSALTKGIEMVMKQFKDMLTALGVEYIECVGVDFNPSLHNAVMHDENDSDEKNKIIEEFQKGYKIGDKVIRHSMVKVLN